MSRSDRILVAAGGAALVLALAAGWILISPPAEATEGPPITLLGSAVAARISPTPSAQPASIVVDVEGAVVEPGIRELPAGARVADAVAAAGGYAPDVDLEAAAAGINLAERLEDGAQILVPRLGGGPVTAGDAQEPPAAGDGDPGGPVNINTASAEELDALPGIGPVTVERIMDARRERPFASLDDALERGVINRGQLEQIEGLATAE